MMELSKLALPLRQQLVPSTGVSIDGHSFIQIVVVPARGVAIMIICDDVFGSGVYASRSCGYVYPTKREGGIMPDALKSGGDATTRRRMENNRKKHYVKTSTYKRPLS